MLCEIEAVFGDHECGCQKTQPEKRQVVPSLLLFTRDSGVSTWRRWWRRGDATVMQNIYCEVPDS
jgi:hypothetical protein